MKKYIITIALLLPMLLIGQSQDKNYIKSTVYQQPVEEGQEDNLDASQKIESISYVDGLGRPIQSIAVDAGGQGQHVISYVAYDSLGRTPKQYLPFATDTSIPNPLDFVNPVDLKAAILAFYDTPKYEDTENPYSEMVYENSPLNRVIRQGAPGASWQVTQGDDTDHTIKFAYSYNQEDEVRYFDVDFTSGNTQAPFLTVSGYYASKRLYKNITKDENWTPSSGVNHTVEEFTNKSGQVVLKRTYNEGIAHDTYYLYDDFGNLTYVLSPEASNQIVDINNNLVSNYQEVLDQLGYQYKYDYRNRLIEKKIPAKGWEYIVYTLLDQPVLTQDARLRENNQWLLTKYDALGRVAFTGMVTTNVTRSRIWMQNTANNTSAYPTVYETQLASTNPNTVASTQMYYTNNSFPVSSISDIHTINYYDEYVDHTGISLPTSVYNQDITYTTQGLPTVSKVCVLGTNDWITSVTGYDEKARPIFGTSMNTYLETIDVSISLLDFTGKVLESTTTHQKLGHQEIVTKDYFTYDHQNRLLTHMQQLDNEPVQLIASTSYDELGQLENKKVGGQLFESGYTDLVNVSVSDNGSLITKTSSSNSYNAGLATIGKLDNDGGLSFNMSNPSDEVRIGLSDTNNSVSPTDIDYMYILTPTTNPNLGRYRVYTRKANGNFGSPHVDANYTMDRNGFSIEKEGSQLHFIQHGIVVYSHTLLDPDTPLIGDVSIKTPSAQIRNLNFYATTIDKSLQKVDYAYNIRGWLTDINSVNDNSRQSGPSDLFSFHINYDTPVEGDAGLAGRAVPLYNGNISQTVWRTAGSDKEKRTYGYKYDALNRIEIAYSRKGKELTDYDHFNVSGIDYDQNGNIEHLTRQGDYNGNALAMDDLSYTYNGNQLLNVSDNGHVNFKNEGFYDGNTSATLDDYQYDINGNMIIDHNKGITNMNYNHLNLPTAITIDTIDAQGDTQDGTITYIYDATGIKLAKVLQDNIQQSTISTVYAGGYIYEEREGKEMLKMFPHPEGYVEPIYTSGTLSKKSSSLAQTGTFSSYQYAFNYTDHLGNVRLTYADSDGDGAIKPSSEIISEKHYYPFGLKHKGYNDVVSGNVNHTANRFAFNGKENNSELGLEWLDFGARNYDASIGRWMNIDILAERYDNYSPYTYVLNSPLMFIDPDGMKVDVADLLNSENGLENTLNLLWDLSEETGLSVTLNRGENGEAFLDYAKDDNNEAIIEESGGIQLGSNTARKSLISAIKNDKTVTVGGDLSERSQTDFLGGSKINLNSNLINGKQGTNGLSNKTMGWGMTFFHELGHTYLFNKGKGYDDLNRATGELGTNVIRMNLIRKELDENPLNGILNNGEQYGKRLSYYSQRRGLGGAKKYDRNNNYYIVKSYVDYSVVNENGKTEKAKLKGNTLTKTLN